MCILCVIQKWSRRVATMLPWLVIPLIGLWTLSQLFPPAFRFEITYPRLACVFVLLITLFWYEILMPQLSVWRVQRSAMLRERKRSEAIEMQKLRKTATRRCRNCLTPYKDQNPGGGKFMCSCCGHISKRPVLDLPLPPGMGNSGILNGLVGKGGKIINRNTWSANGWMCGQDWLENGSWAGGPFAGKSNHWKKHGCGDFCGDDHCLAEKSYSRIFVFVCNVLTSFFLIALWLWRKIFRISSSMNDASIDVHSRSMLDKNGEKGGNGQESRGEKARRKAEEKRLAKLEKEMVEEEERKQREEVARLVELQRRLRDEKTEFEKDHGKGSPRVKERDSKKEAVKRRQERKKEKDIGSSKSNSDVEELEKRSGKESDPNKRGGGDRKEQSRSSPECLKPHSTEMGLGFKGVVANSRYQVNPRSRYLDRMRGNFLSTSRALTRGGLFGKDSATPRELKSNIMVEHPQTSMYKKDILTNRASGQSNVNGDDKSVFRPALIEPPPCTEPKKSWHQLFICSGDASSLSNSNVTSRPNGKTSEVQSPTFSGDSTPTQTFDSPIDIGIPFSSPPFPVESKSSSSAFLSSLESPMPKIGDAVDKFLPEESEIFVGDAVDKFLPEESEIFEDPCYDPDHPIYYLGPVSQSLEKFRLDLGFVTDLGVDKPCVLKTVTAPSEITKPSPIESPLSRSRAFDERNTNSFLFPGVPKTRDYSNNANDSGTWQMWSSSPLGPDTLGLISGPVNWPVPPEMKEPVKEDVIHPVPHKTMASLFKNDEQVNSGTYSSQDSLFGKCQNIGHVKESLLPNALFGSPSGNENQHFLRSKEEVAQNGLINGIYSGAASNSKYELPTSNSWALEDRSLQGSRDGAGKNFAVNNGPHIGGLYSTSDVQSIWSYD